MTQQPMKYIDLKREYVEIKEDVDKAIHAVLEHTAFIGGPEVGQLEAKLASYVNTKHCIAVASGTDALQIALMALGVGDKVDDEVITVPFTWISTAEQSNLQLEDAITAKTKAIITVSLFGQMPNLQEIKRIAAKHKIPVIEDAAQSFGAYQEGVGRSAGVTEIGITSFFPTKPLGCYGDGGAMFCNDDEIANSCRAIRNHGGIVRHHHTCVGLTGRLDTIQAAVLLAKWKMFEAVIAQRTARGKLYDELLAPLAPKLITPMTVPGNTHVYAQYTIRVPCKFRDQLADYLNKRGIPSSIFYPKCLHEQPVFADLKYNYGDFPHSEMAAKQVLSLPFYSHISEDEIKIVSAAVTEFTKLIDCNVEQPLTKEAKAPANYFVHPSSIVGASVKIGQDSKVWHFCHIMDGAEIGDKCNLGQNVFMGKGSKLGNRCKVQNNVSVYGGVICGDDVFLGPSCVFTNDYRPRAEIVKEYVKTIVSDGVSIGANATIVCGHTLGQYAFIGAGTVVTKNVKPFACMVGNPAKQIYWVSKAGEKLDLPLKSDIPLEATCPVTGEKYQLNGDVLTCSRK